MGLPLPAPFRRSRPHGPLPADLDLSPALREQRRQIARETLAEAYAALLGVGPAWLTTELLLRLAAERLERGE